MDWLADKVAQMPDEEFLIAGDDRLTYLEVAERVASRVAELGDRSESQLVVRPRVNIESVVELLAVAMSGATALVAPERPDSDSLIDQALSDRRPAHTVLFTSGSSGGPKGVRLSAANWLAAARGSVAHLRHQAGDRWLCCLPLHHVGGLSIIYRSLYAGGAVVLENDLQRVARWLDRVNWVSLVPTQLHRILEVRTDAATSSPSVLLGGGPASPLLLQRGLEAGLKLLPTYGMTETTSQVATAQRPGGKLTPLPGVAIEIGDSERIVVRGATVMMGYVGEPELDGGFTTADRGRLHPDGSLEVMGRVDRLINTGGEKVDPATVESVIAGLPGFAEVVVLGLPDPEWGQKVVVAFTGVAPEDLDDLVRSRLPGYAIPKQWLRLDVIPRTELGKVDAAAIARLFSRWGGGGLA